MSASSKVLKNLSDENRNLQLPWNLPLTSVDDGQILILNSLDVLKTFNTQMFYGHTLENAKLKAKLFHVMHNRQKTNEIILLVDAEIFESRESRNNWILKTIENKNTEYNYANIYMIDMLGNVRLIENFISNDLQKLIDGSEKKNEDEIIIMKEQYITHLHNTFRRSIMRDVYNFCVYMMISVMSDYFELPFNYKIHKVEKVEKVEKKFERFFYKQDDNSNLLTYYVYIPLKSIMADNTMKRQQNMVVTSLSILPNVERLLREIHSKQINYDVDYTKEVKMYYKRIFAKRLSTDIFKISEGIKNDTERNPDMTLYRKEYPDSIKYFTSFKTYFNKYKEYVKKLHYDESIMAMTKDLQKVKLP